MSTYLSHVVEVAMRHGLLAGRLVDVVEQRVQLVLGRQVAQSSVAERLATQHSTLPTFNSSLSMVVVISAHLPTVRLLFHARVVPLSATEAQKLRCRRTACVEQFTGYYRPKTDHQLRTV